MEETAAEAAVATSPPDRPSLMQLYNNTARVSKVLIILTTAGTLLMSIAIIVCQSLPSQSCDQPLTLFLWVYMVRILLSYPCAIYLHLHPPANASGLAIIRTPQERFVINRMARFKSFLDFFGTAWFMAGNWWFFISQSCSAQAPIVYWMCLAVLAANYFLLCVSFLNLCNLIASYYILWCGYILLSYCIVDNEMVENRKLCAF